MPSLVVAWLITRKFPLCNKRGALLRSLVLTLRRTHLSSLTMLTPFLRLSNVGGTTLAPSGLDTVSLAITTTSPSFTFIATPMATALLFLLYGHWKTCSSKSPPHSVEEAKL